MDYGNIDEFIQCRWKGNDACYVSGDFGELIVPRPSVHFGLNNWHA